MQWFVFFVGLSCLCLLATAELKDHVGRAHDDDVIATTLEGVDGHKVDDYHHATVDQEAFLGRARAKEFDEMAPEEAKHELRKLIKVIDTNRDHVVSLRELAEWIEKIDDNYYKKDSKEQFTKTDTNKDGFVTLSEHFASMGLDDFVAPEEEDDRRNKEEEYTSHDTDKFNHADADGDGKLSKEEYPAFLYPEHHDFMADHVTGEFMEHHDLDHDNAISIDEYMGVYREHFTDGEPEWLKEERRNFQEKLDKDGDGKLDKDELTAWIAPDNSKGLFAMEEAEYLMGEADTDKDKQLTEEEILVNYHAFVNSRIVEPLMMRDEL
ncbi:calumenin-B-like [Dysidea avara]|uniref:calumenin-B-like n=1 Tax=Dysidea avara TaxID=196820 RepID=UPI00331CCB9F